MMSYSRRVLPSFFVAGFFIAIDLISKWAIFLRLGDGGVLGVVPYLHLRPFLNVGSVFGWQLDPRIVATFHWMGVTALLCGCVIWLLRAHRVTRRDALGVGLILGGAVGNLYDRAMLGGVRDWIEISGFTIFNLADVWVVLGALLLLASLMNATIEKD